MSIAVTPIGQTGQTTISGTTISITTGSTAAGTMVGVVHGGNTNLRALSGITVDGVAATIDDSQITSGQSQIIFSCLVSAGTHTVVLTYATAMNGGDHHYLWTYLVTGMGAKFAAAHNNSNASTFNFNTNKPASGVAFYALFDGSTVNSVTSFTGVTVTANYVNPGSETAYKSVVGYETPTSAGTGVNTPLVMNANFTARWMVVTYSPTADVTENLNAATLTLTGKQVTEVTNIDEHINAALLTFGAGAITDPTDELEPLNAALLTFTGKQVTEQYGYFESLLSAVLTFAGSIVEKIGKDDARFRVHAREAVPPARVRDDKLVAGRTVLDSLQKERAKNAGLSSARATVDKLSK